MATLGFLYSSIFYWFIRTVDVITHLLCADAMPIHKATIMPRGNALGMVSSLGNEEESTSRAQLFAYIDVCMGGRVAEELVYGADQV